MSEEIEISVIEIEPGETKLLLVAGMGRFLVRGVLCTSAHGSHIGDVSAEHSYRQWNQHAGTERLTRAWKP